MKKQIYRFNNLVKSMLITSALTMSFCVPLSAQDFSTLTPVFEAVSGVPLNLADIKSAGAITFSNDGLRMFIAEVQGQSGQQLNQYTLSDPFDISTATFDVEIGTGEFNPNGVTFSSDGLHMYVVGNDREVNQYNLTTAFELRTSTFAKILPIDEQETSPQGIAFSSDGTAMFIIGTQDDEINQYMLATPYDISTASFNKLLSITNDISSPTDITFSNDGMKMFVVESTFDDRVFQYNLSTAFDVENAVLTGDTYIGDTQANPSGLAFSNDGTQMFVTGFSSAPVVKYDLTTPFSISSITLTNSFDATNEDNFSNGISISPDGLKMFIVGDSGDEVNQYALNTAFDVSTASFQLLLEIDDEERSPEDVTFSQDGLNMYIVGTEDAEVNQYVLTTAFDISTAAFTNLFSVIAQDDAPTGIALSDDGMLMFITGTENGQIYQYNLSTAYDVTTASFDVSLGIGLQEDTPEAVAFSVDGLKMFIVGSEEELILYELSAAFDVTSASFASREPITSRVTGLSISSDGFQAYTILGFTGRAGTDNLVNQYVLSNSNSVSSVKIDKQVGNPFYISPEITFGSGVVFSEDGLNMYVSGSATSDVINQYELSTPFDISTAKLKSFLSVSERESTPSGVAISSDGSRLFMVGSSRDNVNQYDLLTPFDLSTAAFTQSFSVLEQLTFSRDLTFSEDGMQMFVVGNATDSVFQYALSSAYDISTPTMVESFFVGNEESVPTGISFSGDGSHMFIVGTAELNINQYDLDTPWDLSTASFSRLFSIENQGSNPRGITFSSDESKMYIIDNLYISEYNLVDDSPLPVIEENQVLSYIERLSSNFQSVGTIQASDNTGIVSFEITAGNDNGYFLIPTNTQNIALTNTGFNSGANDFESGENTYILTIVAIDAAGNRSIPVEVVLEIIDKIDEERPELSAENFRYVEGQESGYLIGKMISSDNIGVVGYTISGNNFGYFALADDGSLTLTEGGSSSEANDSKVGDNVFTLNVRAVDASDNFSNFRTITLEVLEPDDEIPVIETDQSFSYSENQISGFEIGTVIATDNIGIRSFTINSGNEEGFFRIDTEGNLSLTDVGIAGAANDFETGDNSFILNMVAKDAVGNSSSEVALSIMLQDKTDEESPVVTTTESLSYSENQLSDSEIGVVTATDNIGVVSFSILSGNDEGFYAISNVGMISLTEVGVTGAANDFETGSNSFTISIVARDAADNESAESSITLNVLDTDEISPILDANQSFTYSENQASGFSIGTITATDNIDVVSFSITSGNDDGFFSLDNNGNLTLTEVGVNGMANDFETGDNSFVLNVVAKDALENESTEGSINIEVTDTEDEAPVIVADQNFTYLENQESGFTIGVITATDNVEVVSFSINTGNTDGFFSLDNTGNLTLTEAGATGAANDFETGENSYVLGIIANDAAGNSSELVNVNLTLTDEDDRVLGLDDGMNIEVNLYPNPTSSRLHIMSKEYIHKVQLFSLNGILVTETRTDELDVTKVANGNYIVKVKTDTREYVENIVVNHN